MSKTTYLNNGTKSDCEICETNAVTVILREGPIKIEVCNECQKTADDIITNCIIDQFC